MWMDAGSVLLMDVNDHETGRSQGAKRLHSLKVGTIKRSYRPKNLQICDWTIWFLIQWKDTIVAITFSPCHPIHCSFWVFSEKLEEKVPEWQTLTSYRLLSLGLQSDYPAGWGAKGARFLSMVSQPLPRNEDDGSSSQKKRQKVAQSTHHFTNHAFPKIRHYLWHSLWKDKTWPPNIEKEMPSPIMAKGEPD